MMRMQCTVGNDERAHSKRRLNTQGAECGQREGKTAKPTTNQILNFSGFGFQFWQMVILKS